MEKNTLDKEPEKEKNKEEIKEETKKEILDLAINDWINEFTKILNTLEIAGFKKNTSALFSAKGEKYAIKNFWERYSDFTKDMFLELENECAELKGMREAVEESEKIMETIYAFLETNKETEKTDNFWNELNLFLDKAKEQWKKFEKNRDKLGEKYGQSK